MARCERQTECRWSRPIGGRGVPQAVSFRSAIALRLDRDDVQERGGRQLTRLDVQRGLRPGSLENPSAHLAGDRVEPGLQASRETGHDDDGQDLHRPLRANGKKVIAHRPADLGKVGIGSAQLDTNPQISRQQVAEALDRH